LEEEYPEKGIAFCEWNRWLVKLTFSSTLSYFTRFSLTFLALWNDLKYNLSIPLRKRRKCHQLYESKIAWISVSYVYI